MHRQIRVDALKTRDRCQHELNKLITLDTKVKLDEQDRKVVKEWLYSINQSIENVNDCQRQTMRLARRGNRISEQECTYSLENNTECCFWMARPFETDSENEDEVETL